MTSRQVGWVGRTGAAFFLAITLAAVMAGRGEPVAAQTTPPETPYCGPVDVAFVIDDTGSMGIAINAVKTELAGILGDIEAVSDPQNGSGPDYRLSLVTFKDDVTVREVFSDENRATFEPQLMALFASGGAGGPEASDEAINTVVNALTTAGRPQQNIDFTPAFRTGAAKILVLVTDAPPAGFDDAYILGVDDVAAATRAGEALAADVKISAIFVPTGGDYMGQRAIMQNYATVTNGVFVETDQFGAGTGAAIRDIIAACGSRNTPPSCGAAIASPDTLWPPNHAMTPIEILGVTDEDGDTVTVTATAITQDEEVTGPGGGDGNTGPDGTLTPLAVRAERNGNPKSPGDGRVYRISFTADDGNGGSCSGFVRVCVPHDNRPGAACIDGGNGIDSTK